MLIIRDTRESGEMLEAAVAAGVAAAGGEALLGGILPTPGAPLLIARHGFDLGVVLSASHNPYRDNGIKFFGGDGYKLSDATEAEIEAALEQPHAVPEHPGRVRTFHGALEDYLRALHERFGDLDLTGRRDPARLRQRRDVPRRAGDLPPPRRRHRRARPRARRPQHQRTTAARRTSTACRPRCRPATTRPASRSTATATACSPWTATASSSTATS